MKNIIITSVAALAVLAISGCAPKKSCATNTSKPVAVKKTPAPAPTPVVKPAAPVTTAPAPVVVEEAEPVEVPAVDAKEAAVQ